MGAFTFYALQEFVTHVAKLYQKTKNSKFDKDKEDNPINPGSDNIRFDKTPSRMIGFLCKQTTV